MSRHFLQPFAPERSRRPNRREPRGAASPALLFAALVGLVGIGLLLAWFILGSHGEVPVIAPPDPGESETAAEVEPPPDPERAEAPIEPRRDSNWDKKIKELERYTVRGIDGKEHESTELHPLHGRVTDAATGDPVYYFWVYLIPADRGDVRVAANSSTPSRFRNGEFVLEHQPAGIYNLLCESREHKPFVKEGISIPYEGELRIVLQHGACIRGQIRDSFLTPLENIEVQLGIVEGSIPQGVAPPMQRLSKSDGTGNFSFWKLPPGTYTLQVQVLGDVLAKESEFRLDPDGEIHRDFTLDRLSTLSVTLTNIADQPIPKARVLLVESREGRERTVRTAYSDLKGVARVEFVKQGSYTLKVQAPGFTTYEQPIAVNSNDGFRPLPIRLELAPPNGN